MFEELGIGAVINQATQQNPETRIVTVGTAVKAMVLNGLGFVNQQLSLVPTFFHNKPTQRLVAPGIEAEQALARRPPTAMDVRGQVCWGTLTRGDEVHAPVSWYALVPSAR